MGFANAAKTAEDVAVVSALRGALAPKVFANMDSDPLIPDREGTKPATRLDLIRSLSPSMSSSRIVEEKTSNFCHNHQQEGPHDTTAQDTELACVRRLKSVVDRVLVNRSVSPAEAEADLRSSMTITDPAARLAAQQDSLHAPSKATGTPEPFALSQYQLWAFYDQPGQTPSTSIGTTRKDAVDRLGLGEWQGTGDELVYWEHRLPPSKSAHQPTAWDADAENVYWQPGGKTYPLCGNTALGLHEVVHDSVTAHELATPISPLA